MLAKVLCIIKQKGKKYEDSLVQRDNVKSDFLSQFAQKLSCKDNKRRSSNRGGIKEGI